MTNYPLLTCTRAVLTAVALASTGLASADEAVIVDVSASSPAMDPNSGAYLAGAAQRISAGLAQQPLGALLLVQSAGEFGKASGKLLDKTIQRFATKTGDTAANYANGMPGYLKAQVAARRKAGADQQSHLTASLVAARRALNPERGPCRIYMLSDLAEYDSGGVRYPEQWNRKLPDYPGFDLGRCTVHVLGAGHGMMPRPAEKIVQHWQDWLKRHGAGEVVIERY